jgi:hypothetical protein
MATSLVDGRDLWGATAAIDLTGKLYRFISLDSNGNFVLSNETVTGPPLGILFEEATQGNAATVQFRSVAKVLLAETLAAGTIVGPDTVGRAIGHSTSGVSAGMILQGGTYGSIVPVKL